MHPALLRSCLPRRDQVPAGPTPDRPHRRVSPRGSARRSRPAGQAVTDVHTTLHERTQARCRRPSDRHAWIQSVSARRGKWRRATYCRSGPTVTMPSSPPAGCSWYAVGGRKSDSTCPHSRYSHLSATVPMPGPRRASGHRALVQRRAEMRRVSTQAGSDTRPRSALRLPAFLR